NAFRLDFLRSRESELLVAPAGDAVFAGAPGIADPFRTSSFLRTKSVLHAILAVLRDGDEEHVAKRMPVGKGLEVGDSRILSLGEFRMCPETRQETLDQIDRHALDCQALAGLLQCAAESATPVFGDKCFVLAINAVIGRHDIALDELATKILLYGDALTTTHL